MAENKYGQTRHTSIIKGSDDENASSDSDDVFDDDDEEEDAHQVLKTDSDESKKTITSTQSQPTSINSSNNPDDKFVNPDGQCRSLHDQRDNRRPALYFRPPLPNSGSQANNKRLEASNMSPSHSLRDLLYSHPNSLQKQLTDDSGHGDSLENLAARVSSDESGHFTPVEVYGQPGVVILMKNRFDFDPAKLEEHRKKKKKTLSIRSPKQKPPVIEKSPKLSGILARLSRSSKASVDDSSAFPSVFRHHSSMTDPKDNV